MSLKDKKILLGITGGIAAYKSVYLLRLLKREGADVRVVMTRAATKFVTPLTFESLSEHPVHVKMFGEQGQSPDNLSPLEHIDLAKWPDIAVIVPATANTIANFTAGGADDLLSTTIAAYEGPVMLAPSMNDVMWENPANQENLRILSNRGFRVVPPETGDLACGYEATGRMAEPESIFQAIGRMYDGDLSGVRVLISAGGTEEDIDPVRVISNRSSGKMGFSLAAAARDLGATVTVVVAKVSVPAPHGVRVVWVRTSAEMSAALKEAFVDSDVLIMAAAVSDFKPARPLEHKIKDKTWTLEMERTEDVLAALGGMKGKRFIVGFALETDNVEANALAKLKKKNCDLIVVNNPLEEGAAFTHDTNVVTVYNAAGELYSTGGPLPKIEIARKILELARAEKSFQQIMV